MVLIARGVIGMHANFVSVRTQDATSSVSRWEDACISHDGCKQTSAKQWERLGMAVVPSC